MKPPSHSHPTGHFFPRSAASTTFSSTSLKPTLVFSWSMPRVLKTSSTTLVAVTGTAAKSDSRNSSHMRPSISPL